MKNDSKIDIAQNCIYCIDLQLKRTERRGETMIWNDFYIQSFSLTECVVIVWVRKRGVVCVCVCVCLSVCLCVCHTGLDWIISDLNTPSQGSDTDINI